MTNADYANLMMVLRRIEQSIQIEPMLSKRDYFAAMVLQGLMANPERYKYIADKMAAVAAPGGVVFTGMSQQEASAKNAQKAVYLADALIEALNGTPQN